MFWKIFLLGLITLPITRFLCGVLFFIIKFIYEWIYEFSYYGNIWFEDEKLTLKDFYREYIKGSDVYEMYDGTKWVPFINIITVLFFIGVPFLISSLFWLLVGILKVIIIYLLIPFYKYILKHIYNFIKNIIKFLKIDYIINKLYRLIYNSINKTKDFIWNLRIK